MWSNFGQKLQNCPKLPHIHVQKHCYANEKRELWKGLLFTSAESPPVDFMLRGRARHGSAKCDSRGLRAARVAQHEDDWGRVSYERVFLFWRPADYVSTCVESFRKFCALCYKQVMALPRRTKDKFSFVFSKFSKLPWSRSDEGNFVKTRKCA